MVKRQFLNSIQEVPSWGGQGKEDGKVLSRGVEMMVVFLENINPEAMTSAACLQRGTSVSVTGRA